MHVPAAEAPPRWEEADNHSIRAALEARRGPPDCILWKTDQMQAIRMTSFEPAVCTLLLGTISRTKPSARHVLQG